jgi:hypothetical protein
MTIQANVAVIIGSPRKQSFNRRVASALAQLAPAGLRLELVEIGQFPIYNQDLDDEGKPCQTWVDFRSSHAPGLGEPKTHLCRGEGGEPCAQGGSVKRTSTMCEEHTSAK